MSCDGMQSHHDERADGQIGEAPAAPKIVNGDVEAELQHEIDDFRETRLLGVNEQRPERVGKALAREPQQLGEPVSKQASFELGRQIGVERLVALMGVVQEVIEAERFRHRYADWQVDEECEGAIFPGLSKSEVVTELVNCEQERLVDDTTDAVRHEHDEPPRSRAQRIRKGQLSADERGADVLGAWARAVEAP